MMVKIERLRDGDDITKVIKSNKKVCSNVANLFYLKNNVQSTRMTVIVSKKVSNKAVIRNKVKRQIKAIIRELRLVIPNCDVVIIAKSSWLDSDYTNNKKIMRGLIKKAGGSLVNGN